MPPIAPVLLAQVRRDYVTTACLLLSSFAYCHVSHAAVFADFDQTRHARFLPDGTPNPSFIIDEGLLTGVGSNSRAVLITPQHYVTATHAPTSAPVFRGSDGVTRTYSSTSITRLTTYNAIGAVIGLSDIQVHKLDAPIPTAHGVMPLAIFSGPASKLMGQEFLVVGQGNQMGRNVVDDTVTAVLDGGANPSHTISYTFDTDTNGGTGGLGGDEAGLIGGDSGHSALIQIDGQLGVLGTHYGIIVPSGSSEAAGDFYTSFSTLLTPYLDEIQTVVAADGQSISTIDLSVTAVPEPSSIMALAFLGVLLTRRRQR